MNIKNAVKQWLTEKENKRYAELLQKKQVSYFRWIAEMEDIWNAAGQDASGQGTAERGEETAREQYAVLLASEGVFMYSRIKNIGCYFKEHPQVKIVYGDEEVCWMLEDAEAEPERKLPWFKPGWSPDLFKDYFYFGSAVAVRSDLLEKMASQGKPIESFAEVKEYSSLWKKVFAHRVKPDIYRVTDETAYRQWMQACVKAVGGFERRCKAIGHIPEMWFSCESEAEQQKFQEWRGVDGESRDLAAGQKASISVVIPSKDNPEILEKCIRACVAMAGELSLEVLVVDNGSSRENRQKIESFIGQLQNDGQGADTREISAKYLYFPMEFNFSKMCNIGAAEARGDYLLFLNDDVELCVPGTLKKMVSLAAQEHAGAVGLKLLYPGTAKIQHAGITNLPMGPVHKLQFMDDNACYYKGANRGVRNVLAVTAACLMVKTEKFKAAGGFTEELRVAFNDVDLCFRLYEMGYHNICVNDIYAYHHESLSRGGDESPEKLKRLLAERAKLYERHPGLEGVDPYYSVHLNGDGLDTGIRPAYLTSRNQVQEANAPLKQCKISGCRQDQCLMVRVEDFREGRAVGYGVVLGDNNACYDKALCFGKSDVATGAAEPEKIYTLPLEGQYRPDLEDNMPDQANVALSGYDVKVDGNALPKGTYRIGMTARNRVTGLKLINWTNRYVTI